MNPTEVRRTGRDYSHACKPETRGTHPLVTVLALTAAWAGFGWIMWTAITGPLFV